MKREYIGGGVTLDGKGLYLKEQSLSEKITFVLRPEWREGNSHVKTHEALRVGGTADAKALRRERAWLVRETSRTVWLGPGKQEGKR